MTEDHIEVEPRYFPLRIFHIYGTMYHSERTFLNEYEEPALAGKTGKTAERSRIIRSAAMKKTVSFFNGRKDASLVFVFGSFVRNELTAASDIDLGVYFYNTPDIYQINAIKEDLCALLKRDVDVVVLNDASPIIKMQVLKNGILVFEAAPNNYSSFYGDTVKQYDDLKLIRKNCEDNILKGRIYA